ncbi:MAG: DUF4145 domain-containing protein [Planctomycetes bacterium]|nr:DUF4145 domain-containing protein [Planctomycetota bacterium]
MYDGFYWRQGLLALLETMIGNYESDRESDGEGKTQYDQAERFAKSVLKISEQLIEIEPIDDDLGILKYEANNPQFFTPVFTADSPLDEESPLKLVWERFSIDLAWESVEKMTKGARRIFDLYKLVLDAHLSKPTRQFLARLSRCYIWGFEPECVMLCRSVLDTAFRENILDDICERHCREKHVDFTLSNRIYAAFKEGLIDRNTRTLAQRIKRDGDNAVHYQPDITKDVFGTICDTLTVIEQLQKKRRKL